LLLARGLPATAVESWHRAQHERAEIGPSRLQDGGAARRARTADTH